VPAITVNHCGDLYSFQAKKREGRGCSREGEEACFHISRKTEKRVLLVESDRIACRRGGEKRGGLHVRKTLLHTLRQGGLSLS